MANYRGGERGYSNYGQDLIKTIRNGQTERQVERDQMQKIIHGVAEAGLTGMSGAIRGDISRQGEQDTARKTAIMQQAIAKASQARDAQIPMASSASPFQDMAKSAMDDAVMKGRAQQKTNMAAYMAPVGGDYTPQGLSALNDEAQTGADDLNTSKSLIGSGTGMGRSIKTWGDGS